MHNQLCSVSTSVGFKQKEAAGKIDPALAKAIEAMNAVLKQINDKIAVGTDRNGALGIRVVAQ